MTKREIIWYLLIIFILAIAIVTSLMVGATYFSVSQLIAAFGGQDKSSLVVLLQTRLPRVLASLVCGGMLAVAGTISQAAFHNYLADPSILGVTSAGSFLILLAGFLIPAFPFDKLLYAFIGGGLILVFLSSRKLLQNSYQLIIVGVVLSLTFSGFQQLLSENSIAETSTFNGITWSDTLILLIFGTIGMAATIIVSPWANYLKMSDQQLASRGLSAVFIRLSLLVIVVYLAAGVTSVIGVVPFVGIIVPNVARRLVGRDYQTIVPFSMLLGAAVLLMVDTLGRTVALPSEIPAATIMTVIGGPFLIWLLWRQSTNEVE